MRVDFDYFKQSGKWYTEWTKEEIPERHFHEAVKFVEGMLNNNSRPGLVDGPRYFHTLCTFYTNYGTLMYLFPATEKEPWIRMTVVTN